MKNETVLNIIESLQPNPQDYDDNDRFYYWLDYACELDSLSFAYLTDEGMDYMTKRLTEVAEGTAEHHALTDVRLTISEQAK